MFKHICDVPLIIGVLTPLFLRILYKLLFHDILEIYGDILVDVL